jgi:hypothetical protein
MAVTHTKSVQGPVAARKVIGRYLDSSAVAADVEITLGFRPKRVKWVNLTDRIEIEWFEGMSDNTCLKRAANGTGTLESVGITVSDDGFTVNDDGTLAAIAQNKQISYVAEA